MMKGKIEKIEKGDTFGSGITCWYVTIGGEKIPKYSKTLPFEVGQEVEYSVEGEGTKRKIKSMSKIDVPKLGTNAPEKVTKSYVSKDTPENCATALTIKEMEQHLQVHKALMDENLAMALWGRWRDYIKKHMQDNP